MGYLAGGGPNLFNVRVPKIVDGARISRHFLEIFVEPLKVARRLVACAVLVTAFVLLHLEVWWRYFIYLSLSFYFSTYLGGGIHLFLLFQYFTFVTDESLVHTLPWLLRNLKNTSTSVEGLTKKKKDCHRWESGTHFAPVSRERWGSGESAAQLSPRECCGKSSPCSVPYWYCDLWLAMLLLTIVGMLR
jgi:hypothetical protein